MAVLCLSKVTCRDFSPPPMNSAETVLERSMVSSADNARTAKHVFSCRDPQRLRVHAPDSVEHDHPFLSASVQWRVNAR